MKTKNIVYGVIAAALLIMPACANLAAAGTEANAYGVKEAPAIYTEASSYAGNTMSADLMLEQPAADR
ncbi:hypothetical protein [Mitsuokella sp. WILCCON 0060]|uniref:hypothetical protein n=1 Tax=unclassified Mitsuokella TaxID=2637239 RepID=UPI003F0EBF47